MSQARLEVLYKFAAMAVKALCPGPAELMLLQLRVNAFTVVGHFQTDPCGRGTSQVRGFGKLNAS
jgi:hypothetical protein